MIRLLSNMLVYANDLDLRFIFFFSQMPKLCMLFFILQETEFLDITSVRDTRVGKFAKIPKVSL